jgi:hypothetical protein
MGRSEMRMSGLKACGWMYGINSHQKASNMAEELSNEAGKNESGS